MIARLTRAVVLRPGTVLDTYPGLGFGNYLYFALKAYTERAQGRPTWVLDSGLNPLWTAAMPLLRDLLAKPATAAFRRVRHLPQRFHQTYGVDFTAEELERFVTAVILPARPPAHESPDVVVNVRRGDYYSDPGLRRIYAFDVPGYVRTAVGPACAAARPAWLSVVSDDVDWCRRELAWLTAHADTVTFGARTPGPVGDFWEIASGKALVLTNSTFSYWAAYTSRLAHGAEHRGVWTPAFHQRNIDAGSPWQHDPAWHAVPVQPEPEAQPGRAASAQGFG